MCEEATNCNKYGPVWEKKQCKQSESGNPAASTLKANSSQSSLASSDQSTNASSISASKNNVARQSPFCLNKDTFPNEGHYMKNCTKSTDAVKKKLIKEFYESKLSAMKQLRNERDDGINWWTIDGLLMDKVPVTVPGHYEADHVALSAKNNYQLADNAILFLFSHYKHLSS